MSFLVVTIIDNPDLCQPVLEAWREIGVRGATIFESTGMGRMIQGGLRDDMPLIPRMSDFLGMREQAHRTILSVVKDEATADRMVVEAEKIVGKFEDPHTGICFILPVLKAYGVDWQT